MRKNLILSPGSRPKGHVRRAGPWVCAPSGPWTRSRSAGQVTLRRQCVPRRNPGLSTPLAAAAPPTNQTVQGRGRGVKPARSIGTALQPAPAARLPLHGHTPPSPRTAPWASPVLLSGA